MVERLEIHHINIGDGDCTLIAVKQLEKNGWIVKANVLIDGGVHSGKTLRDYLSGHGLTHKAKDRPMIDYLIITHYHADHTNGLEHLLRSEVGTVIDTDACLGKKSLSPAYMASGARRFARSDELRNMKKYDLPKEIFFSSEAVKSKNARSFSLSLWGSGASQITLRCLAGAGVVLGGPQKEYVIDPIGMAAEKKKDRIDPNSTSMAFLLEWSNSGPGKFCYLTCGDLTREQMKALLENNLVIQFKRKTKRDDLLMLKINHHGSYENNFFADQPSGGSIYDLKPDKVFLPAAQQRWGLPSDDFLVSLLEMEKSYKSKEEQKEMSVFFTNQYRLYLTAKQGADSLRNISNLDKTNADYRKAGTAIYVAEKPSKKTQLDSEAILFDKNFKILSCSSRSARPGPDQFVWQIQETVDKIDAFPGVGPTQLGFPLIVIDSVSVNRFMEYARQHTLTVDGKPQSLAELAKSCPKSRDGSLELWQIFYEIPPSELSAFEAEFGTLINGFSKSDNLILSAGKAQTLQDFKINLEKLRNSVKLTKKLTERFDQIDEEITLATKLSQIPGMKDPLVKLTDDKYITPGMFRDFSKNAGTLVDETKTKIKTKQFISKFCDTYEESLPNYSVAGVRGYHGILDEAPAVRKKQRTGDDDE